MNAIPESVLVKRAPKNQLGLRIFAANACHHSRASFLINDVNHWHSSFALKPVDNGPGL